MKVTEKEIAKQLTQLINNNITKSSNDDNKWKIFYNDIIQDLKTQIKISEDNVNDFKENKLTFNLIEQEGYLRCLKTMLNTFKDNESYL